MIEYTPLKGITLSIKQRKEEKMEDYGFDFGWGWWDECGEDDWDDWDGYDDW